MLTLVTRDLGKVAVLARGARKSTKRFRGSLELFSVLRAEIGHGRGEVLPLTGATLVRAFRSLIADFAKMEAAGKALELVRDVAQPSEPDARLFDTAVAMLALLDGLEVMREEAMLAFTLRLCAIIGLAPRLDRCAMCGTVAPSGKAALFDPRMSSIVCRSCGGGPLRLSGAARARASRSLGAKWTDEGEAKWGEPEKREVGRLVSAMRGEHLERR